MKHRLKKTFICFLFAVGFQLAAQGVNADTYDIYINAAATEGSEAGTAEQPFNTIAEGITAALARDKNARRIFVSNGTYAEHVTLGESVKLYGESRSGVVIDGGGLSTIVTMEKNSELRSVTLNNSKRGVVVKKNAKVTINNCKIEDAEDTGIEIEPSTKKSSVTTVSNSEILKGRKGIYAIDGSSVNIVDNDIHDNDEEGIDVRSKTRGTIQGNDVYDNGEGGIEVIVGKSSVRVKNNNLHGNSASGLAVQYYKSVSKKGKVTVSNNTFKKNDNYGIVCSNPLGGGNMGKTYFKKYVALKSNSFDQENKYATACYFGKK